MIATRRGGSPAAPPVLGAAISVAAGDGEDRTAVGEPEAGRAEAREAEIIERMLAASDAGAA